MFVHEIYNYISDIFYTIIGGISIIGAIQKNIEIMFKYMFGPLSKHPQFIWQIPV